MHEIDSHIASTVVTPKLQRVGSIIVDGNWSEQRLVFRTLELTTLRGKTPRVKTKHGSPYMSSALPHEGKVKVCQGRTCHTARFKRNSNVV